MILRPVTPASAEGPPSVKEPDGFACMRVVHLRSGGDLAGEDDVVPFGEDFDSDAGFGVAAQVGVEHAVGDEVADLVGVAFGDGLGGEDPVHGALLLSSSPGGKRSGPGRWSRGPLEPRLRWFDRPLPERGPSSRGNRRASA